MFDPAGSLFSLPNLLFLARASINTCDTIITSETHDEAELGAAWVRDSGMQYIDSQQPQCTIFKDDKNNAVLVIAGIGSVNDFSLAMQGSFQLQNHAKLPGFWNAYTLRWFRYVDELATLNLRGNYRTLTVVGHSFGGSVASAIAFSFNLQRKAERVAVFTCGSPRFCDSFARDAVSTVPHYRLMNFRDPTPAVPPRIHDAPLIYPLLNGDQISAWLRLVHPGGGVAVNAAGELEAAIHPLGYSSPLMLDFRTGWQLYQSGGIPAHAMRQYADALTPLAERQQTFRVHGPRPEPMGEPAIAAAAIAAQQQASRQAINQVHANQTRVPASETSGVVKIKRRARRWFVEVNGQPYYAAKNKRDARGVAVAARAWLRQYLQNAGGFLDPAVLVNAGDDMI